MTAVPRPHFVLALLILSGSLCAQSADEYSRQAAEMARNKESLAAAALLEKALQAHPNDVALLLQLAELWIELGHYRQAELLLDRALGLKPGDGQLIKRKAEARLLEGDFQGAEGLLLQTLKISGEDAEVRQSLARICLIENRLEEALEQARRAVQIDPSNPLLRRFLAGVLDLADRRDEAFHELKAAVRLAPQDASLLFQMGLRSRQQGNLGQALEFMEMALQVDGENPLYHKELASLCALLDENECAIRHANLARKLLRAFEDYIRAVEIAAQGRQSEAIHFLEEAVRPVPQFVSGRLYLAGLYQKRGEDERALEIYRQILEQDPLQESAREQSAWLNLRHGSLSEAIDLLRGSASPNQGFFEGYKKLMEEDWAGALQQFRSLERQHPLNPQLLQLISYALNAQGEKQQALEYLEKARRLNRNDPGIDQQERAIRFQSGMDAFQERRWSEAAKVFEALAGEESPQAEYFFNAAYALQQLGKLDEAIGHYRTGLRMQPGSSWARLNLATCLYLRMRYQESSQEWERLLREEKSADAYLQLGMCYSHLNRSAEAESAFHQALKMGLETPQLLYNLGLTRFRMGRQQDGLALIRKAARSGYPPAVRFMRLAKRD